jgi:hypothetical protein
MRMLRARRMRTGMWIWCDEYVLFRLMMCIYGRYMEAVLSRYHLELLKARRIGCGRCLTREKSCV